MSDLSSPSASDSPSAAPAPGAARRWLPRSWTARLVLGAALLASQMGHGDGCCAGEEDIFGPPTQAACPQGSTLTYQSFGKPFMEQYCTGCHHSDLVGAARHGAPTFHDFDTLSGIKAVSEHIDQTAAAGPAGVNQGMPEEGPFPTTAERYLLGEWIACGMP
jgi:hypothetical protein